MYVCMYVCNCIRGEVARIIRLWICDGVSSRFFKKGNVGRWRQENLRFATVLYYGDVANTYLSLVTYTGPTLTYEYKCANVQLSGLRTVQSRYSIFDGLLIVK